MQVSPLVLTRGSGRGGLEVTAVDCKDQAILTSLFACLFLLPLLHVEGNQGL